MKNLKRSTEFLNEIMESLESCYAQDDEGDHSQEMMSAAPGVLLKVIVSVFLAGKEMGIFKKKHVEEFKTKMIELIDNCIVFEEEEEDKGDLH